MHQIKRITACSTTGPYPYAVVELNNGKHEEMGIGDLLNELLNMIKSNRKEIHKKKDIRTLTSPF